MALTLEQFLIEEGKFDTQEFDDQNAIDDDGFAPPVRPLSLPSLAFTSETGKHSTWH